VSVAVVLNLTSCWKEYTYSGDQLLQGESINEVRLDECEPILAQSTLVGGRRAQYSRCRLYLSFLVCLTACAIRSKSSESPSILLFNGSGTSPNDVTAIEKILVENDFRYTTVNSRQLNEMNQSQLRTYRLLIVPGGNFEQIGNGLTPSSTVNVRNAVRHGLNYFGICAGAFFAGNSPYNGPNLTSGVRFTFYALEDQGVRKAAVEITIAGSSAQTHYWEDGPQLSGWGNVVAKYPDRTPAIVEGNTGDGWVVLSGIHPEAPESWRRGLTLTTPASVNNAYAATLISTALNRIRLKHY
jgi:glutamine amidotransferase-like uncharacterized protein